MQNTLNMLCFHHVNHLIQKANTYWISETVQKMSNETTVIGHTYACHMVNTYAERHVVATCLFDYLTDTRMLYTGGRRHRTWCLPIGGNGNRCNQ